MKLRKDRPMANTTKQQAPSKPKPSAIPTVAAAERILSDLDVQRRDLAAARAADDTELKKNAYGARILGELAAIEALRAIGERGRDRDQRIREIDAAIAEAGERLAAAKAAEARAADRQRAAELSAHVDELSQVPAYIEKHLAEALRGLIAFEHGVAELHQKGVMFPTDVQLRLGMVAVLGTWLQQLPKMWFNELAGGVRFLAPAQRKTALSYWAQLEPSLRNAIGQRGKPESEAA
jgi:hypothetical protein